MKIITKRRYWFIFSGLLAGLGLAFLLIFGLRLGLDFTGGSLLELKYSNGQTSSAQTISQQLATLDLGQPPVQLTNRQTVLIRTRDLTEEQHQKVLAALRAGTGEKVKIEELQFSSIGPIIGQELQRKAILAIIIVSLVLVGFIAWSFRRVSRPVASWKYGVTAVVAMLHDVLITLGVFALLGYYLKVEIDVAFVAAVLTVFGYSINDTIVIFDRVRENLAKFGPENFESKVEQSVQETLVRSLNTSFTTLLVLLALLIFGGESIRTFVLALTVGISAGTYSSIFVAAPLLVAWHQFSQKRRRG